MTSVQSTENRIAEIDSKEMVALLDKLDKLHQQGQEKGVYFSSGGRHSDELQKPEEKEARDKRQKWEQAISDAGRRAYDREVKRVESTFDALNPFPEEYVELRNVADQSIAEGNVVVEQLNVIRLFQDFNKDPRFQRMYRGQYATADRTAVKFGKRETTLQTLEKMLVEKLRRIGHRRELALHKLHPKERAGTIAARVKEQRRLRFANECGAARYAAEQAIREMEEYKEIEKKAQEALRSLELRVNSRFTEWLKEVDSVLAEVELLEVKTN